MHSVFVTAPAAAPRRAAVQAPAWLLGRKKIDASAAAALGAGQFKFRTPETEGRTQVCSDFFFWGIQKPVFFFGASKKKMGVWERPLCLTVTDALKKPGCRRGRGLRQDPLCVVAKYRRDDPGIVPYAHRSRPPCVKGAGSPQARLGDCFQSPPQGGIRSAERRLSIHHF